MKDKLRSSEEHFRKDVIRRSSPWIGSLILFALLIRTITGYIKTEPGVLILIISLGFFIIPLLLRHISVRTASMFFLFNLSAVGLVGGFFNGGMQATSNVIYILLPLAGFLTNGKFGAKFAITLTLVQLLILATFEHLEYIQVFQRPAAFSRYLTLAIFLGALASYISGSVYERSRRKSEKRIFELVGVMQENARLASLGEMASGVAHEINNPLAIIVGTAEKIKRMLNDPSKSKEQIDVELDKLISIAFRAGKISKSLLTFSRDSKNDPFHLCRTGDLIKGTLSLCQERFRVHQIKLEIMDCPDVELECREGQISQVLLNLLNNAFDAVQSLPEKWVRLELKVIENKFLQFSVTDSGKGVPAEIAHKLMEPFFTTKAIGQGTGLGLSISRGIVASHHGSLILDQKSPNTRFVVQIPMFQTM